MAAFARKYGELLKKERKMTPKEQLRKDIQKPGKLLLVVGITIPFFQAAMGPLYVAFQMLCLLLICWMFYNAIYYYYIPNTYPSKRNALFQIAIVIALAVIGIIIQP